MDKNRYNSSTSDDSGNGGTRLEAATMAESSPMRKNTRQRHRFNKGKTTLSMDAIPSFHDFQRSMQIRTLYRQYTRLIGLYSLKHDKFKTNAMIYAQKMELQNQVRTEFKHHKSTNHKTDVFYIQKSLAEGQRRYKELYTMIKGGTTATTTTKVPIETNTTSPPTATISDWPWNKAETKRVERTSSDQPFPFKFPPKSNL